MQSSLGITKTTRETKNIPKRERILFLRIVRKIKSGEDFEMHAYTGRKKKKKKEKRLPSRYPASAITWNRISGGGGTHPQLGGLGSSISRETVFVNQRRGRLNKTNNACFAGCEDKTGGEAETKAEEGILDKRQRNVPVLRGDVIALEARRKREVWGGEG